MTKTKLLLLLSGLGAASVFCSSDPRAVSASSVPVAWEQPPGVPPCPGGDIIIKAADAARRNALAWEQPPGVPPCPGGGIIIKALEPSGDRVV